MLAQLSIRDIVLIDRLDLQLGPGLVVLTGETGAGKSILLDAFSLALGGRGDGSLVRQGQSQGQITAAFDLPLEHPAILAAQKHDIVIDGDLILRRVQMADGRTRAFVNDQPVTVSLLRALGALLHVAQYAAADANQSQDHGDLGPDQHHAEQCPHGTMLEIFEDQTVDQTLSLPTKRPESQKLPRWPLFRPEGSSGPW